MDLRYLLRFLARQSLKLAGLTLLAVLAGYRFATPEERVYQVTVIALVTLLWALLSATWSARNKWFQVQVPPYNILHIVASPCLDGAERVVQLLCRYTNSARFRTFIACPGEPLQGTYQAEGFTVERLDASRPTLGSILKLCEIISVRNIHLIHAHDHRASLLAWICAGFWDRTPVISHLHSTNPWLRRLNPFSLLELILRNRYALTLACSEQVKKYFLKHNSLAMESKIITVVNGVEAAPRTGLKPDKEGLKDLKKSLGIPEGQLVYGTVGRLETVKGVDLLLEAFFQLRTRVDNVVLLIVGDGNKAGKLKRRAEELGLQGSVIFTGYRRDVYQLLELMDVFILASRWEGLPMVIMEAMSCGLPVIAANVGGVAEVVLQGRTGLLVEKEDAQGLAVAMERLSADRRLRGTLSTEGRKLVEAKFNALTQAQKVQEVYCQVLQVRVTADQGN